MATRRFLSYPRHARASSGPVLAALALMATSASAQVELDELPDDLSVHKHDGFYFSAALGGSYLWSSVGADPDPGGASSRVTGLGLASHALVGGTPGPGWVIGGGTMNTLIPKASVKSDGQKLFDDRLVLATLGVFSTYYFEPRHGLHVLGHLGAAVMDLGREDLGDAPLALGFAAAAGIGYDWWIGQQWSLGVLGRLQYARTSATIDPLPGLPETTVTYNLVLPAIAASLTYH